MKFVKTRMDDETYASLVLKRKAEGLPTISALFLRKCGELTDETQAAEVVARALTRARKMSADSDYRLKDLFPNEWDGFPTGVRIRAGRMFAEKVAAAQDGIRRTRKSSMNHQYYQTSASARSPASR